MVTCKSIHVDQSHFNCLNTPGMKGLPIGPGMDWMFQRGQVLIIKEIGSKRELLTSVKLIDGGELFLDPIMYSENGIRVVA